MTTYEITFKSGEVRIIHGFECVWDNVHQKLSITQDQWDVDPFKTRVVDWDGTLIQSFKQYGC